MQYLQIRPKKVQKIEKFLILLCSRGITLAKMNQSHQNTNWNCNSLLQNNKPSFNATTVKIAKKKKKVQKTVNNSGRKHNATTLYVLSYNGHIKTTNHSSLSTILVVLTMYTSETFFFTYFGIICHFFLAR
jgi:hypothetical protein